MKIIMRYSERLPLPLNFSVIHKEVSVDKEKALLMLAKKRQSSTYEGYKNLCDFYNGYYECDYVSPYTKSCHNVNATVMVMLQDWCSEKYLLKIGKNPDIAKRGHDEKLATNKNLKKLLQNHLGLDLSETYGTNLFPFIKPRDMGSNIAMADLLRAAEEFAVPQIKIIRPKIVICLGLNSFNAIRKVTDRVGSYKMEEAIDSPFFIGSIQIWCQAHTGARGQNNRKINRVNNDWNRMTKAYNKSLHPIKKPRLFDG